MSTIDLSRQATDTRKHYAGVRMQQGRVLTDDDFNEAAILDAEELRRTRLHAIGAYGAPDTGFLPKNFAVDGNGKLDFKLSKGHLYLGGLRLEMSMEENFLLQKDWLNFDSAVDAQNPPANGQTRTDLVWIECWQQPVTAIEDSELFEVALGGPDTTTRWRTMRRVHVTEGVAETECAAAWSTVSAGFAALGTMNAEMELATTAKLTVSFTAPPLTGDLCSPNQPGGYLGAENQAIRVQMVDATHFTWGYDNAAPLYRVQLSADNVTLTLLNQPRDAAHWPLKDQVVELLPWSAALVNGECIAELSGHLCKVSVSYNPDDHTLEINSPVDANFGTQWKKRSDKVEFFDSAENKDEFFYLRVWNRGDDLASPAPIPIATGELGNTGLKVTFNAGPLRKDDYWIIAARPASPDVIVPWVLGSVGGAAANGVKRYRAPIALIQWSTQGSVVTGSVLHDCRPTFDPLTDLRGCCIEVKPGDNIHRALKKVTDAGGGCLCLLPGDHMLTSPIDLTGKTSICMHGFGPASRLLVSSQISTPAPFVLTNARDITFESFVVINQSALPVWACGDTVRLRVEGVFVLNNLEASNQPLFALQGACHGWRLADNVFIGSVGLSGRLLASSSIFDNVWVGARRGIDLVYAQELQIERNDFLGMRADLIKDFDTLLDDMATGATRLFSGQALKQVILRASNAAVTPTYIGIEINGAFDVDIIDNEFYGSSGLYLEWTENSLVQRNRFRTLVVATTCGVAHGFRFSENRIGVAADDTIAQKPMTCEAGLVLLSDAVECRISDNVFANVKQGVVFESDLGNKKAIARDFSANLFTLDKAKGDTAQKQLEESEARAKEISVKSLLLSSSFFRVGTSKRVVIEGNQFHAAETGIEWSGTTLILDFRIVGNSFIGCQDVAIQIEPDPRILMLADPVDTKVRLIENNRFEIYSGAVRATIGAVRVEKNDIRIDAPALKVVPPKEILTVAANYIFNSPPMAQAVQSDDTPLVLMMAMEATSTVENNLEAVNATSFAKEAGDSILKAYMPNKGDALADKVYVMKTLADLGAKKYLGTLGNALLPKWTFNSAGFVINLAGIQNRVVHNRLYGNNPQRPGGVLYNAVSGEVRDNEIVVPGTALLLTGKLSLASGYQGAEVVGNSLASIGVPGSKTAVYALAIPSLSPGYLAINNNLFKGSVMIGGDPLSAQGISTPKVKVFPGVFTFYNAMKFDMGSYAVASLVKAFPPKLGNLGLFKPPGIFFQIWQIDPHANRPIVHFCQNRVIQGWVGIFQAFSGAYWSAALLKRQASQALIANIANNVLDYGGSVVGYELVVVGNYSQSALKYRVGGRDVQAVANIPAAVSF